MIPLVAAIFGFRTHAKVYLTSVATGFISMWIWQYGLNNPYGIEGLVVGTLINMVTLYLAQKLWKNESSPMLEESV